MSDNSCCGSTPECDACELEVSSEPWTGCDDKSSQYVLFDDQALTQNVVTDSPTIPVGGANSVFITGVYINRVAAATIGFTVLVSENGETWTSAGTFNVSAIGYFSMTNPLALNAQFVKVRASITVVSVAVFAASANLFFA